jgi:heme-degrading monooxygenase HmoA
VDRDVSAGEFTGDAAGRPVAVAVRVTGPAGLASWMEACARLFAGTLPGQPGFLGSRLLEYRHAGQQCVLISVTLWEDLAWFRAWHSGRAFAAAYDAWRGDARHAGTAVTRADFPFRRAPVPVVLARLEPALAARLGTGEAALKLPEPAGSTWG